MRCARLLLPGGAAIARYLLSSIAIRQPGGLYLDKFIVGWENLFDTIRHNANGVEQALLELVPPRWFGNGRYTN